MKTKNKKCVSCSFCDAKDVEFKFMEQHVSLPDETIRNAIPWSENDRNGYPLCVECRDLIYSVKNGIINDGDDESIVKVRKLLNAHYDADSEKSGKASKKQYKLIMLSYVVAIVTILLITWWLSDICQIGCIVP
jgi:hypothetical protein